MFDYPPRTLVCGKEENKLQSATPLKNETDGQWENFVTSLTLDYVAKTLKKSESDPSFKYEFKACTSQLSKISNSSLEKHRTFFFSFMAFFDESISSQTITGSRKNVFVDLKKNNAGFYLKIKERYSSRHYANIHSTSTVLIPAGYSELHQLRSVLDDALDAVSSDNLEDQHNQKERFSVGAFGKGAPLGRSNSTEFPRCSEDIYRNPELSDPARAPASSGCPSSNRRLRSMVEKVHGGTESTFHAFVASLPWDITRETLVHQCLAAGCADPQVEILTDRKKRKPLGCAKIALSSAKGLNIFLDLKNVSSFLKCNSMFLTQLCSARSATWTA